MIFFKKHKIKKLTKKLKSMQQSRLHSQPKEEVLAKERIMYWRLGDIFKSLIGKKKYPFSELKMWECIRAAADLDDPKAQFQLGKYLLEEAKCRETLQKDGLLASQSNERQTKQLFEEALSYFKAAENLGHIEAKRLRGLCYINGWGVEEDKDKGFDLVVESIDKENSWDKVPQIFEAIGLNKPEFFAALTKRRNKD